MLRAQLGLALQFWQIRRDAYSNIDNDGAGDKGVGNTSNCTAPAIYNARGRLSDVWKLVFETHKALPRYEGAILEQNNLRIGL